MSFILEALKKSEQQRQAQNASQQKVRNRTLSLIPSRSARRSYWLLAGLLSLVLLCGWLAYSELQPTPTQAPELALATPAPPAIRQTKEPEPVVASPAPVVDSAPVVNPAPEASALQQPVAAAEPAPVPNIYVSAPKVYSTASPAKELAPTVEPQRVDVFAELEKTQTDQQVATVAMAQTEPQAIEPLPLEASASQMPTYHDLSDALRDRMHPISMSMHFYNREPNRRLVRINDRLLHEGDWVSQDLELVEITPNGVVLDYLGKSFEMRSARR